MVGALWASGTRAQKKPKHQRYHVTGARIGGPNLVAFTALAKLEQYKHLVETDESMLAAMLGPFMNHSLTTEKRTSLASKLQELIQTSVSENSSNSS